MSFAVSVRDTKYWENAIRFRAPLNISEECRSNSRLIAQIVPLAKPALSRFDLSDEEVRYLSESVAYLLRTDLVKTNTCLYSQMLPLEKKVPTLFGENGPQVRLINDSGLIGYNFNLRETGQYEKLINCGAEWFRCYSATIFEAKFTDKLTDDKNSFTSSFVLADVTAFLLDPTQLLDYSYSKDETEDFKERLAEDLSQV